MPSCGAVLAWVWASRAGKVLAAILLIVLGSCLARLVLGPVEQDRAAPGQELAAGSPAVAASSPTVAGAAPQQVAGAFAHGWLAGGPADEWYGRLLPHATPELAAELADTGPARVPDSRLTGPGQVVSRRPEARQVAYPAEHGTLRLQLVRRDSRWLVDDVTWGAASSPPL